MGVFRRFENKAEDVIEGGRGGLEPVKLCKRAAKEMQREKMVGMGHEYAPTLFNVLVSSEDDRRMCGYYPTLAGEMETFLTGRASQMKLDFDCPPLVRFIVDNNLKRGKFDIIAENVSPAIIEKLRKEEKERYGEAENASKPAAQPVQTGYNAASNASSFDPFIPADMQNSHYVPLDAPVNPAMAPASTPLVTPAAAAAAAAAAPAMQYGEQAYSYNPRNPQAIQPGNSQGVFNTYDSTPNPSFSNEMAPSGQQPYSLNTYDSTPNPSFSNSMVPVEQQPYSFDSQIAPESVVNASGNYGSAYDTPARNAFAQPAVGDAAEAKTVLFGAAQNLQLGALIEVATGRSHPIVSPRTLVGRGTTCSIVISDPGASRQHAEVIYSDGVWLIRDLNSTNGTLVNNYPVKQARIFDGDALEIGNTALRFQEG